MTTKVISKPGADWEDAGDEADFKPWSREQASAWRRLNPSLSPWRVVAVQAATGLMCSALVWALTQRSSAAWSALYGAAAVVVPSALLARGMTRDLSDIPGAVGHAVFRFMFWEMVKIGAAIAMLLAAPKVVQGLSWLTLLLTMMVCVKMNWLALLWRRRPRMTETRV
jgi:ATP synthase protein I